MQVVLCEAGLLRQTLQLFVSHLRPMLAREFNVHGAFVPFLQSLADESALASAHAVHMAVALLSMHLNGCEVTLMAIHRKTLVLVCRLLYMCDCCCPLACQASLQNPFAPRVGPVSWRIKDLQPTPCRLSERHMP